jgi:hypothetical protein
MLERLLFQFLSSFICLTEWKFLMANHNGIFSVERDEVGGKKGA